jgi:hypothetical protein
MLCQESIVRCISILHSRCHTCIPRATVDEYCLADGYYPDPERGQTGHLCQHAHQWEKKRSELRSTSMLGTLKEMTS